jgi:hypothetical protein
MDILHRARKAKHRRLEPTCVGSSKEVEEQDYAPRSDDQRGPRPVTDGMGL